MTTKSIGLVKDLDNSDRWGCSLEGLRDPKRHRQSCRSEDSKVEVTGPPLGRKEWEMSQSLMDAGNHRCSILGRMQVKSSLPHQLWIWWHWQEWGTCHMCGVFQLPMPLQTILSDRKFIGSKAELVGVGHVDQAFYIWGLWPQGNAQTKELCTEDKTCKALCPWPCM